MKQQVENMFHELFLSTWSLELWTQFDLVHSDRSSDQTTLCSDSLELATTGPRDITLRVLNSSTQFSMLLGRRQRAVIVCRDSSSLTHLAEELVLAWEPSSSPR